MLSQESKKEVIATLPFRKNSCDAIVAMPISFNFMDEMIGCTRVALGLKTFDLLGIPGFSKRFSRESKVISDTISLAVEKHFVNRVVIFQHVDFHDEGKSSRFADQLDEDFYHKRGLIDSSRKLKALYSGVEVTLIYARLAKNQSEIVFSKIFEDGGEEICLITPYLFKGVNKCETTVIQCLDYRFRSPTRTCLQDGLDVKNFNIIGLPGSAKPFLENRKTPWKGIKVAYEQHDCRSFIIVHHADCGAYGGSSNFENAINEESFHRKQLKEMKSRLLEAYPDAEVKLVYARLIDNKSKIQFVVVEN